MIDILIHMFEVQLGASLLIQVRTDTGVVRVLADAGIFARGYELDHVYRKLLPAMTLMDPSTRRIDLIIGTHYDRDHLAGLVPIIEDLGIGIGQVWLPPVLNDVEYGDSHDDPFPDLLLSYQLEVRGDTALWPYLYAKVDDCDFFAETWAEVEGGGQALNLVKGRERLADPRDGLEKHAAAVAVFQDYVDVAAEGSSEPLSLDPGVDGSAALDVLGLDRISRARRAKSRSWQRAIVDAEDASLISKGAQFPQVVTAMLKYLVAGSAEDAISAIELSKVVGALKGRGIAAQSHIIPDGLPQTWRWREAEHRFVTGDAAGPQPSLTLLGPSRSLVEKHADRLPRTLYRQATFLAPMPVKSITPSNQLSYLVRLDAHGQRMLISGDAGMVDFRRGRRQWHGRLIDELADLNVTQVGHHAGRNAWFYHALLTAPVTRRGQDEFLLVSHATDDAYRPSPEFRAFLEERATARRPRILLTSRPAAEKVAPYVSLIEPPVGPPSDRGDVSLMFADGKWFTHDHAISVDGAVGSP